MKSGLSWRLGGGLIAAIFASLIAWVGFDLQQSRERELDSAEHLGNTLTSLLEGHFLASTRQINQQLLVITTQFQTAVLERQPRSVLEAELRRHKVGFPELASFRIADVNGNYLYDASGHLSTANIGDRDYFIRLRDGKKTDLVISPPIVSRVSGETVIVFARRLEDNHGNFAGIVVATLGAGYFERYYQSIEVGPGGTVALWSSDMTLFARWPQGLKQELRLSHSQIPALLAAGNKIGALRDTSKIDGQERVYSYRQVDDLPLVFVVGLSETEVLAEWRSRAVVYGILGFALLAMSLAMARLWLRRYRAIEALSEQMSRAYEEKTRQSRALLNSVPDMAWLLDNEGRFLAVNEAFCQSLERSMAEIIGRTVADLFPEDAERLRQAQLEVYHRGERVRLLGWFTIKGQKRPLQFTRTPVYDEAGKLTGLAGVAADLTEHFAAEERQRLITHFFDYGSEAMLILDSERRVLTINRMFTTMTGYELADVKGQRPGSKAIEFRNQAIYEEAVTAMLAAEEWRGELRLICKDDIVLPVACRISAIRNETGEPVNWSVFLTDLSERKAAEAHIDLLTHFDSLTALPNRQGFSRFIDEWLAADRQGLLMLIDLDDQLNRINDAFGHAAGDAVLHQMALRLGRSLGENHMLGRLGGDLFAVLLDEKKLPDNPDTFIKRLLDNLAQPIKVEDSDIVLSPSAGICRLFVDGSEVAVLLQNADAALHQARAMEQGNFRFFSTDMNLRMAERLRLESALRGALARGELEVYYQPQVDLHNGQIVGFESLLRWTHPELGAISPVRFIPVAEESRLILPIGAWVLEEACRQNKAWQEAGMSPKVVAVNLSAVQFLGADIVGLVKGALERTGLAARYLELEITESVLVEDPERVVRLLDALKVVGVNISIDDFGTGYSSLAYLKRFPIDKIKIDRTFVRDLETSANDAAIVRMVIGIAAELEHQVIAEGVEAEGQLEFLRQLRCDAYQGFYCSPAVPASQIPGLVAARQPVPSA
ncbi:MAG: EAL domain-containing protein [Azonexus sp.]|jgi:diguanylate cyclase (GGDEF)-like protein/PAS domain S-box-containing protein|nr:EAL domain-containing protein [Azonexus sp.]